jgi:hypothetical protein
VGTGEWACAWIRDSVEKKRRGRKEEEKKKEEGKKKRREVEIGEQWRRLRTSSEEEKWASDTF